MKNALDDNIKSQHQSQSQSQQQQQQQQQQEQEREGQQEGQQELNSQQSSRLSESTPDIQKSPTTRQQGPVRSHNHQSPQENSYLSFQKPQRQIQRSGSQQRTSSSLPPQQLQHPNSNQQPQQNGSTTSSPTKPTRPVKPNLQSTTKTISPLTRQNSLSPAKSSTQIENLNNKDTKSQETNRIQSQSQPQPQSQSQFQQTQKKEPQSKFSNPVKTTTNDQITTNQPSKHTDGKTSLATSKAPVSSLRTNSNITNRGKSVHFSIPEENNIEANINEEKSFTENKSNISQRQGTTRLGRINRTNTFTAQSSIPRTTLQHSVSSTPLISVITDPIIEWKDSIIKRVTDAVTKIIEFIAKGTTTAQKEELCDETKTPIFGKLVRESLLPAIGIYFKDKIKPSTELWNVIQSGAGLLGCYFIIFSLHKTVSFYLFCLQMCLNILLFLRSIYISFKI